MARSSDAAGPAFVEGWRRVLASPALVLGVWLATLATALPLALAIHDAIAAHLGDSLLADSVAAGVNRHWWIEFSSESEGVARTFTPEVIGFAAALSHLSRLVVPRPLPLSVVGTIAVFGVVWLFLWGGILDRYARARRVGSRAFFGACGLFFFRFLRLFVLTLPAWLALAGLGWLLLGRLYPWLVGDVTAEPLAFAWFAACSATVLLPALALSLVVDYARVRAVVEDRRSMIGALVASVRFIRRHPGRVAVLYVLNGVVAALVLTAYWAAAPGAGGGDWQLPAILGIGQAYVVARLLVRLAVPATATVLFQRSLAHDGYTALAAPVWPDSPAAEAIDNAARYGVRPQT